jgi:hypothetical protein
MDIIEAGGPKRGYAVTFYAPLVGTIVSTVASDSCDEEFHQIRNVIYKTYVTELTNTTEVNTTDTTNITVQNTTTVPSDTDADDTPLPADFFGLFDNETRRSLNVATNHAAHRHLKTCSVTTCKKSRYQILLDGCTSWCTNNRRLLGSEQNEKGNQNDGTGTIHVRRRLTSDTNNTISIWSQPDPKKPVGSKKKPMKGKNGKKTAEAFYKAVEHTFSATDPCRTFLTSLVYQLCEIDITY